MRLTALLQRSRRPPNPGVRVRIALSGALVPELCACCGTTTPDSELLRRGDHELFVPYCDDCRRHQGSFRTRRLAGGLASALVGLSLALGLPFAARAFPFWVVLLATLAGALLPLVVVALFPPRRSVGHAAFGAAVELARTGEVACARAAFGHELARLNGGTAKPAPFRERRLGATAWWLPTFCLFAALGAHELGSALVRVVNLSGERLIVAVDGEDVVLVEPSSLESPTAGDELSVRVGSRELTARTEGGRIVDRVRVDVATARLHLYAPASEGHCFALETAHYGRDDHGAVDRRPLEGPPYFWPLPQDLGGLFSPLPEAGGAERRLTGGAVTVLRQARCEALP